MDMLDPGSAVGSKLSTVKPKNEAAASIKVSRLPQSPLAWNKEEHEAPPKASGKSLSPPLGTI